MTPFSCFAPIIHHCHCHWYSNSFLVFARWQHYFAKTIKTEILAEVCGVSAFLVEYLFRSIRRGVEDSLDQRR